MVEISAFNFQIGKDKQILISYKQAKEVYIFLKRNQLFNTEFNDCEFRNDVDIIVHIEFELNEHKLDILDLRELYFILKKIFVED